MAMDQIKQTMRADTVYPHNEEVTFKSEWEREWVSIQTETLQEAPE